MTLNDRERFILHTMSVMVVDSMIKKFKNDELEDRHEKGVLMHYLRALEKLKVEQSNDIK